MIAMIKKRLLNKKGFSYVFICVILMVIMMISAFIFEFIRINTIAANVREKFEDALVSISVSNYKSTYASNRDSFAATYKYSYSDGHWNNINNVSATNISNSILNALNAGEENQVNSVTNINFSVVQEQGKTGSRFHITGSCKAELPFIFLWDDAITLDIKADTEWTSKF